MTLAALLVAALLAFLAIRFVTGMIKFVILAVIVIAVAYFVMNGVAA